MKTPSNTPTLRMSGEQIRLQTPQMIRQWIPDCWFGDRKCILQLLEKDFTKSIHQMLDDWVWQTAFRNHFAFFCIILPLQNPLTPQKKPGKLQRQNSERNALDVSYMMMTLLMWWRSSVFALLTTRRQYTFCKHNIFSSFIRQRRWDVSLMFLAPSTSWDLLVSALRLRL